MPVSGCTHCTCPAFCPCTPHTDGTVPTCLPPSRSCYALSFSPCKTEIILKLLELDTALDVRSSAGSQAPLDDRPLELVRWLVLPNCLNIESMMHNSTTSSSHSPIPTMGQASAPPCPVSASLPGCFIFSLYASILCFFFALLPCMAYLHMHVYKWTNHEGC